MTLRLLNNLTKLEYVITGLTDDNTSVLYWDFTVSLPEDIIDGDYNYTLEDDETVLSTGLARVGNYTPEVTAHTTNNNGYICYDGQ